MAHARVQAEHGEGTGSEGAEVFVLGAVVLAGDHDDALDPGVFHHRQRGRVVAGDGAEEHATVEEEGVEGMLLADDQLFEQRGTSARGLGGGERGPQGDVVRGAEGGLRRGAGRWFDHQRIADLGGEAQGLVLGAHQTMSRDGEAGRSEGVLHLSLVAEVARLLGAHPGHVEELAGLGGGDLDLLHHREQAVDAADAALDPAGGVRDLSGLEGVVDAVVRGEEAADLGREELLGVLADHAEAHAGERAGGGEVALGALGEVGGDEDDSGHRQQPTRCTRLPAVSMRRMVSRSFQGRVERRSKSTSQPSSRPSLSR